MIQNFCIPSTGGGTLACRAWFPDGRPEGVVQIVHGMAEHKGRYHAFAQYLNDWGYLVVAEDHLGHGESGGRTGREGRCYSPTGWGGAVADVHALYVRTKPLYPRLPYFLFGHSMGSFLTRSFLIRYPEEKLTGAVLCGTAWLSGAVLAAGERLVAAECRRRGPNAVSPLLDELVFGQYNRKFSPQRTAFDWISSVPEEVDRYCADPMCGGETTVGLAEALLEGFAYNQSRRNLRRMDKTIPVYLISGDEDPVGDRGRGVLKTAASFRQVGMEDVAVQLWAGRRHELLHERNRAQIFLDVAAWLEGHTQYHGGKNRLYPPKILL